MFLSFLFQKRVWYLGVPCLLNIITHITRKSSKQCSLTMWCWIKLCFLVVERVKYILVGCNWRIQILILNMWYSLPFIWVFRITWYGLLSICLRIMDLFYMLLILILFVFFFLILFVKIVWLIFLISFTIGRGPSWSKEICNCFLWISSVVKLLKLMQRHLPRLRYVGFLIFLCFITLSTTYSSCMPLVLWERLLHYFRCREMRIHQFWFHLRRKAWMLDRSFRNCMLLS